MMIKRVYLLCMAVGVCLHLHAQELSEDPEGSETVPWGFTMGAAVSTHGGGAQLNYLRGKGARQWMFSLDTYLLEDDRETRIESAFGENGGRYSFGKLNYAFLVTPTVGFQQNLFPAKDYNLLNFRVGAQVGPTLAMLTPYYVEIFTPVPGRPAFGYGEVMPFDPDVHQYEDIIRKVKLFSSEFDFTTQIGLSVRTHILIDFTRGKNYVGALQLGLNVDAFAEPVPLMAFVDNKKTFVTGTLGLVFGMRR